jgi:hypothetical protein
MADPAAASGFYLDKLSFARAPHSIESGNAALMLPGTPVQRIEFIPSSGAQPNGLPFRLVFSVPDLRRTANRLRMLGLPAKKQRGALVIADPDGDQLVFIRAPKENP